ncbi:MAG: hypothetical protein HUJ54_12810, partial [Erysipelotrichaceae bacterium]|nr:hypothetical protein [Erysipelotrichaceae bacterium]
GEFRGGYKSAEGEYANYRDFTISFNPLKGSNESPWSFLIENYEGKKSGNICSDRRNVKSLNINLTDEEFKKVIRQIEEKIKELPRAAGL